MVVSGVSTIFGAVYGNTVFPRLLPAGTINFRAKKVQILFEFRRKKEKKTTTFFEPKTS